MSLYAYLGKRFMHITFHIWGPNISGISFKNVSVPSATLGTYFFFYLKDKKSELFQTPFLMEEYSPNDNA